MILHRLAEGIFDIEDLKFRINELADFITHASKAFEFDLQHVIAVGYSNGANIAASTLLLRLEILSSAILLFSLFKSAGSKVLGSWQASDRDLTDEIQKAEDVAIIAFLLFNRWYTSISGYNMTLIYIIFPSIHDLLLDWQF